MNLNGFTQFQSFAQSSGVLFYFSGPFGSHVTVTVGEQIKSRLDAAGVKASVKRKLFSTFVEMAQNVMHYGAGNIEAPVRDESGAAGVFTVGQESGKPGVIAMGIEPAASSGGTVPPTANLHWIVCANQVNVTDIPRISEKLNAIRAMSAEEIRESYKEQLINDGHAAHDSISKGAGLGLLTIARDSKAPLEYSFASVDGSSGEVASFFVKAVI